MKIIIEFFTFEGIQVRNFTLKKQFWILAQNFPKMGISTNGGQIHFFWVHDTITILMSFLWKVAETIINLKKLL